MLINNSLPADFVTFNHLTNVAHWIYRLWAAPFIIFGLISNLTALIIFVNWARHLSIYVYSSILCLVNMCILINDTLFNYFLPYVMNNYQFEEYFLPILCHFNLFVIYLFRYCFIWLLTCINIDRCLFLSGESHAKSLLCHPRSAVLIGAGLVGLSAAVNIHFLLFCTQPRSYSYNMCHLDGSWCQCTTSNLVYLRFWQFGWPATHLFFFGLLPLSIIFMCLICIVRHAHCIRKNVNNEIRHNSALLAACQHHHHHLLMIVRTLICLDLLFPLTVFPALILQTYVSYAQPHTCRTIGIFNILFAIGSAGAFIKNVFLFGIYYLSGTKFRLAVKMLFRQTSSTAITLNKSHF